MSLSFEIPVSVETFYVAAQSDPAQYTAMFLPIPLP